MFISLPKHPPKRVKTLTLEEKVDTFIKTLEVLDVNTDDLPPPSPEDCIEVRRLMMLQAEVPQLVSATTHLAVDVSPSVAVNLRHYLDEYGASVTRDALEVRNLITNRLIEETSNPDPRIRMKALELLGKHVDIGLFTDKTDNNITAKSTEQLQMELQEKLKRLKLSTEDVTYTVEG